MSEEIVKVSFDFDGTLSEDEVRDYAAELTEDPDIEVWIVTARYSEENAPEEMQATYHEWNKDVYEVAEVLGIPKERIIFTEMMPKEDFFEHKEFLWHLDDCEITSGRIMQTTETFGIPYDPRSSWLDKCELLLS